MLLPFQQSTVLSTACIVSTVALILLAILPHNIYLLIRCIICLNICGVIIQTLSFVDSVAQTTLSDRLRHVAGINIAGVVPVYIFGAVFAYLIEINIVTVGDSYSYVICIFLWLWRRCTWSSQNRLVSLLCLITVKPTRDRNRWLHGNLVAHVLLSLSPDSNEQLYYMYFVCASNGLGQDEDKEEK